MRYNQARMSSFVVRAVGLTLALALLAPVPQEPAPQKWAVIVGVSKFPNLKPEDQLEFADKDAEAFQNFILSPRGREFPKDHIQLLTNDKATTGKVKISLGNWIQRNSKAEDTVYIFIATHGMVEQEQSKAGFLVTYDSEPESLYSTALSIDDLNNIVSTRLGKAGRIVMFTDACRAGKVGMNIQVKDAKQLMGFSASRASELSQEGKQFGGGHGAFTYMLLKGLGGDADDDKDKRVTVQELIDYLNANLPKATGGKQHIQSFGTLEGEVPMSFVDKAAPEGAVTELRWPRWPVLLASLRPFLPQGASSQQAFDQAIKDGRLLPPAAGNAWDLYAGLPASQKDDARDSLSTALEDEGQRILRAYLKGEDPPLGVDRYRYGAQLFARASELSPGERGVQAKARFCAGRALVAERKFTEADPALRESIALDKDGPYSYNALGISYLYQGRNPDAIEQFQQAIERAPKWAYPHYNTAIAYTNQGKYREAERAYKAAIERGPNYGYLHLNLGSLYYMHLNQPNDALRELQLAIKLRPEDPHVYNELGGYYQARNNLRDAEDQYRKAIAVKPDADAYISLAIVLVGQGKKKDAEDALKSAINLNFRNTEAHRALGQLYLDRKELELAQNEFTKLLQIAGKDAAAQARLGDVYAAQKQYPEAIAAYRQALEWATDPKLKSEITRSLDQVQRRR